MSTALMQENRTVNVLLVEDDDGDAKAIERAFKKAKIGNPVTRAIDGVDALKILKGEHEKKIEKPYLLLVDLNMPRLGGIDLVTALREDPAFNKTIIFILTTSKSEEDKLAAYDLNVAGYIVKETAGQDFLNLIQLLDCYWRVVEMP